MTNPTNNDWQSLLLRVRQLESQLSRQRRSYIVLAAAFGLFLAASFLAVSEIQASSGPTTNSATQSSILQSVRTENLQIVDRDGNPLIELDANERLPRMVFRDTEGQIRAVLIVKRAGDGQVHAQFFLGDRKSFIGLNGPAEGWVFPSLQITEWGGEKKMEMRIGDRKPWFAITEKNGKGAVWPPKE
jgi:hypothetical protein